MLGGYKLKYEWPIIMRYRFFVRFWHGISVLPIFLTVLGYWIPLNVTLKNTWRENILDHEYLWRESTQIERSSQKVAQQVWNIKLDWTDAFVWKICLSSPIVLHYRLIVHKEEERTFGKSCIYRSTSRQVHRRRIRFSLGNMPNGSSRFVT